MKPFFILFHAILYLGATYAQKPEGKVTYQVITNLNGIELPREGVLYFNKEQSVFYHSKGPYKIVIRDYQGRYMLPHESITTTNDNSGKQLMDAYFQDSIGHVYFKDFKKKQLVMREYKAMTPYLGEEPQLPQFKWKIEKEYKQIGKFKCQKAITEFRGRTYEAWFTQEVKVNNGPWKLHGLPGLILEASDSTGEVKFLFTSITIPTDDIIEIVPPTDGKKATFEEWKDADYTENEKIMRQQMSKTDRNSDTKYSMPKRNYIEKSYE